MRLTEFVKQKFPAKQFRLLPQRVLFDRSLRSALLVFVLSRAIVFSIFLMATHLYLKQVPLGQFQEPHISISRASVVDKIRQLAKAADSGWYIAVAKDGYERMPFNADRPHNWAFFPLYPLLLRFAGSITGSFNYTGIVLSNIFFLLGLILVHKTVRQFGCDEATADRAVFYLGLFPTSYFFSLPMTESLFLFLTVGSFWAAKRESWWLAGVFGALASATRYNGIFVLPALLVLYWQQRRFTLRADVLGLLLIPAGLLAFMIYLYLITGNALAFIDIQAAWEVRSGFFLQPLFSYILNPFDVATGWNFKLLNFASAMMALVCCSVLIKRGEWALALYTFISVVVPLSTLSLEGHTRYVMVVFPVFIMLALAGRSARIDQVIRTVFSVLLGLMSAMFALYFTIAMV